MSAGSVGPRLRPRSFSGRWAGPDVHPLTLGAKQAEELHGLAVGPAEPVWHPGIEFHCFACRQDQVTGAQDHPQFAVQHVEPFVALVDLRVGFLHRPGGNDVLVGLDAAGLAGKRNDGRAIGSDGPQVDAGVPRSRGADQLVEGYLVGLGERKQEFQVGPPLARFEPGESAHGNARGGSERRERDISAQAQSLQPRANGGEDVVEVFIHSKILPYRQKTLPELWGGKDDGRMTQQNSSYDVLVVGGGAAGLSAALMLGRTRRRVAVVNSGEPRNAPAHGVHGFLSRDGISPAELLATGRDQARHYGADIINGTVVAAAGGVEQGFEVTLDDGRRLRGQRLLITTGLVDELPDIPGLRGRWGRDVLHCPFCHGWEVRDQAIGVLGTGPWSVHQALLFRQWSSNITLFLNDVVEPSGDELEQLAARGVKVVPGAVETVRVHGDALKAVVLAGGPEVAVDAVVVGTRVHARLDAFAGLGLAPVPHPLGIGDYLETDAEGATSVPGVWAAGNVTDMRAQVLASAAAASWTAVMINNSLMAEEMDRDLAAYRESLAATGA